MEQSDLDALTGLYKRNPSYFSQDDYQLLSDRAAQLNQPPPQQREADFDMISTAKQLVYGGVKGIVGIYDPATNDKPRNTIEEYAHTLGETAGFLGMFFAPVGGILEGTGLAAKAVGMERTFNLMSKAGRALRMGEVTSIPVQAGEWAAGKFGVGRAAKIAESMGEFVGGGERTTTIARQMLGGSIRMGAAGAVSSVNIGDGKGMGETIKDALLGGAYGMAFGGVMDAVPGTIGSIPALKNKATMAMILKGVSGALVNGLPALAGGADPLKVAYEGALGAYFGVHALGWKDYRAQENLTAGDNKNMQIYGMQPEENDTAMLRFKGREDELKEMGQFVRKMYKVDTTKNLMATFVENIIGTGGFKKYFPGGIDAIHEGLNGGILKSEVGDYIRRNGVDERMKITQVARNEADDIIGYDGIHEDGSYGHIKATDAIEDAERSYETPSKVNGLESFQVVADGDAPEQPPQTFPDLTIQRKGTPKKVIHLPEEIKATQQTEEHASPDFEAPRETISYSDALKEVVGKVFDMDPRGKSDLMTTRTLNFEEAIARQAKRIQEGDPTSRGINSLIEEYLHLVPNRVNDISISDMHSFLPYWNTITQSVNIPHMYFSSDGMLHDYQQKDGSPMALDGVGNQIDTRSARYAFHAVAGEDDAVRLISGYLDNKENGDVEYKRLDQTDLTAEHFTAMSKQLYDKGYYLFSGGADKPIFLATKFIDKDLNITQLKQKYASHLAEMETIEPGYIKAHQQLQSESGLTPEQYRRITVNNILYYERMNNMPYAEAMKSSGMIKDLVAFNKRVQPLMTNFYQVDKNVLSHFSALADKELNYNMIMVHDDDKSRIENTDGGTTVHTRNMDVFHKAMGIPPEESHTKSFLYGGADSGQGMHIIKHAEHRATKAMSEAMDKAGVGYIARPSGVKQYGNRKIYHMEFDGKELLFSETKGGKKIKYEDLEKTQLKSEDFHISSDIHDDAAAHLNHAVAYPKQASYHLSYMESGKPAVDAHMSWIMDKFFGDPEANKFLEDFARGDIAINEKTMQKLMDNKDSTGVMEILSAMESNETLRERFMEKQIGAQGDFLEGTDDGEGGPASSIPDNVNGVKRMVASFGGKIPLLYTKEGRKVSEQAIARLFTSRLAFPKIKTGGKGIMYMYEPGLAVQINGGDHTAMNTPKDLLTKDTFFLGETKRKMKLEKGATLDAENKLVLGKTTLEEQYAAYESAVKLLKSKTIDQATFNQISDATHFTVTRVPMDSFSGTVRLRFAGFTGETGGHILLHSSVKKQLGGADNDIDTAYYFHGLPKEYQTALENARGNFQKYEDLLTERAKADPAHNKGVTDEQRIFFTDNGDLNGALKQSKASMLDPIYRASLGHAVSKGRGAMLPVAVRYVDIMKKMLDTTYEKGNVFELNGGRGLKVILDGRDYAVGADGTGHGTGETLGAYGQRAINSAADAGKEAGMVTQEELKAIITASAFKRISIIDENGKTVLFDADKQDFNRDNHKDVLSMVKDLVSNGVKLGQYSPAVKLMDTEVGLYDKFLKTMFGYDADNHRPYNLDEIRESAKAIEGKFVTPYNAFIPILAKARYSDGLIERIVPNRTKFLDFLRLADKFSKQHPLIADSILPKGVYVEWQLFEKHLNLYGKHFDPDKPERVGNLATIKGMREFASDDAQFQLYLKERLEIWKGYENHMDLKEMAAKYGDFYHYQTKKIEKELQQHIKDKDFITQKIKDDIREKYKGKPNEDARVKFLADERYQVSDYISSRINDIASGAFVSKEVERLKIEKEDMPFIGSTLRQGELNARLVRMLQEGRDANGQPTATPTLVDLVKVVKYADKTFHRKKWDEVNGKEVDDQGNELVMSAQEATRFHMDNRLYLKMIADQMNEARAQRGVAPISYPEIQNLYHTLLVSTVLRGSNVETGQQRLGLDTVPDRVVEAYSRTINDIYSESLKGRAEVDFKGYYRALDKAVYPDPHGIMGERPNEPKEVKGLSEGIGGSASGTPAPAVTATVETAASKFNTEKRHGIAVLKTVGLDLRGAYFADPASKLSRHERDIAQTFSDFFKEHQSKFGGDINNFVQFLHGIMPNTTYNPKQWTMQDLDGAYYRLKDMQKGGTLIDMVAEMFTKEKALPYVNWATWLKFPGKIADRLMRDPNAVEISEVPVFDSQGLLNPDATKKMYVDDKGAKHEVYTHEFVPTNVLHKNLDLHKWGDIALVEMEKKAKLLFDKYLPFLNGGVKDPETKVDHTDTIFKAAAYTRERDAALRMLDKKREETSYARLRSLDDVPDQSRQWRVLKDKELHIIEGGKTVSLTGAEVVKHMTDGMEALNLELTKWIKLDDASLDKCFVKNPDGKLNFEETKRNFVNALKNTPETPTPYDAVQAFDYIEQARLNAKKMALDMEPVSRQEALALKMFDKYDELYKMHPSIDSKAKAEFFINHYDNELNGKTKEFSFNEETILRSPMGGLYKEAKRSAVLDLKSDTPRTTERAKLMRDLSVYLRAGTRNEGNIPPTDLRARLFGETHYNQYGRDIAYVEGKTSTQDYHFEKLMNRYRFEETKLMEGWFPHRNFDRDLLQKQLIQIESDIRAKKSFSKDDEIHFNNLQDAYRRIIEEDRRPGSTDDGLLYDHQLTKDGIMPMMHVVNQTPAALVERVHDLGGFSTHPYEMVNAVMSVIKSGTAKLISTLNNDNILRFQDAQMAAGAPADYVRGWTTYLRQFERQANNRPSVFTNEMLSDPTTKIKWTPAYWFSDHAMLVNSGSRLNKMYREVTKADAVTDVDKAIFRRVHKREMTSDEEVQLRDEKAKKYLDFSKDASGEFTPQALKNMENASRMFKHFSQFEAKLEMAALLFHPRFAINNIYGGLANDFIYNGIVPMKQGHDIKYWNGLNPEKFKTMDDVHKWMEQVGVLENVVLKDTGYDAQQKNKMTLDKVTYKASWFLRKTEPWLRREAAMHGYMAAREANAFLKLDYDNPMLIDMARKSVEASQFLYNSYNRSFFMSTNLGKVFTRFKLWGMNSLKMQGDIADAASYAGFKKGSPEMARYQRMMMANVFMAGLAMMFPHTIFQSQMPQPVDSMLSLSQTFFADDEKSKQKRKNLYQKDEDPLRDVLMQITQPPVLSFPLGRVPLAVYDLPQTFRAIMTNDVHAYATATTLNTIPFGRFTRDLIQAYESPEMSAELMGGIPLHRFGTYFSQAKKARMLHNVLSEDKVQKPSDQEDIDKIMQMR